MIRKTLLAVLVALGLTTCGDAQSPARPGTRPSLRPQGLRVTRVLPGSTAERQGIEVGDVIVRVDGNPVRSVADLRYRLGQAGRVAELGVIDWRTGWENSITVYPRRGRIGVDAEPAWVGGLRPLPPVNPPRRGDVRPDRPVPQPLPFDPWDGGNFPMPVPSTLP
jgi:hypothetical protein